MVTYAYRYHVTTRGIIPSIYNAFDTDWFEKRGIVYNSTLVGILRESGRMCIQLFLKLMRVKRADRTKR